MSESNNGQVGGAAEAALDVDAVTTAPAATGGIASHPIKSPAAAGANHVRPRMPWPGSSTSPNGRTCADERDDYGDALGEDALRTGNYPRIAPELGRPIYRACKRAFDILFSGAVIAVAAIPSAILCVAIRLESPGSPIYAQTRLGRMRPDGTLRPFTMYKFRSMYQDADERFEALKAQSDVHGAMFKMRDDPRVTRIGRFIRKHSIDEFPQFVNVFLGQMSVVGPRPPLPRELPDYTAHDMRRLAVKPGLTGPWQVSGRSDLDFEEMVELDLEYIRKRSLAYDVGLIAQTIGVVINGEGAA